MLLTDSYLLLMYSCKRLQTEAGILEGARIQQSIGSLHENAKRLSVTH